MAHVKEPTAVESPGELLWVVDSGATRHMTYNKLAFVQYYRLGAPVEVLTAGGTTLTAEGSGTVVVRLLQGQRIVSVAITDVLYVPGLIGNLLSVPQLQDKGVDVTTSGTKGLKFLRDGHVVGEAQRVGKAYTVNGRLQSPERACYSEARVPTQDQTELLHRRFAHMGSRTLLGLQEAVTGLLGPIGTLKDRCEHCIMGKTIRVVNRVQPERVTVPLARIHTDFWGPYRVPSLYGNLYFVTFTDEATRKVWTYFSQNRASIRTIFPEFRATVELETSRKIKVVRCDNAPEFKALGSRYRALGLQFEFITPYFHQQVGISERLNRSLGEAARALLQDAGLPQKFWEDAIATACYIRNRAPIGPGGKTPEEAFTGKKPYVGHFRVWGCLAYAHIPTERRYKLDATAVKCCFTGYHQSSRQYRLYDPVSRKVILSTAPTFKENRRLDWPWESDTPGEIVTLWDPMAPPEEGAIEGEVDIELEVPEDTIVVDTGALQPEEEHSEQPEEDPAGEPESVPVRRSGRATHQPNRWQPLAQARAATTATKGPEEPVKVPKSEEEALKDPLWKAAMQEEIAKLQGLQTWSVAKLPPGKKAVGYKWVYTVKYTATGLVDRYKARLVAQGFSQKPGDSYLETFSPTVRPESVRTLLAVGCMEDLEIRVVDVVSAYPRAQLHAEIHMVAPSFLGLPPGTVLLVHKPLYGLKQSGREWYLEACRGLKTLGFTPCYSDPSVFITEDRALLIGLYVDDMVILGPTPSAVEKVVQGIKGLWEIKDIGDISLILGIKVTRNRKERTLKLSQKAYIQGLVERFRLQGASPVTLPVGDRSALTVGQNGEAQADQALYMQAIGSLLYIAKSTRFDVLYAVGQLSQHITAPTVRHWNQVLKVIRYLKGTEDLEVQYGPGGQQPQGLIGYCDADYAGDTVDRRSVTGHLFLINGGPVSWSSTKQRCVATSTTEAEYISLAEAAKQGQWLRALLRELQRSQLLGEGSTVHMLSDNQGCIALAKDPVAHNRTKHIDVRYHYIRDLIVGGRTTVDYCPTEDMTADILTKPLGLQAFKRCRGKALV
jgi:hypothetical protein